MQTNRAGKFAVYLTPMQILALEELIASFDTTELSAELGFDEETAADIDDTYDVLAAALDELVPGWDEGIDAYEN